MRAVIFVNGVVTDYERLRGWLRPADRLLSANGGSRHCVALDLRPHVVVGDLDSADATMLATWVAAGTGIERHPPIKALTDLELAIERAFRDGADDILLLGALGGRLDQTLADLLILAQRNWPVRIRVAEEDQVAQVLSDSGGLTFEGNTGSVVSIVPLSPQVTGITYTGMRYPLENACLSLGSTRGISNEIAELPASIRIASGRLLVIQSIAYARQIE